MFATVRDGCASLASIGPFPTARSQRPEKALLTAWLLLLLDDEACHGYGLQGKLAARRLHPDPAALYRMLRKLEDDGCVVSDWAEPAAGPPRRLYNLTPHGRGNLDEVAATIKVARDHHDTFLRARDEQGACPDPDADGDQGGDAAACGVDISDGEAAAPSTTDEGARTGD
jgi:DNA-binding PadR family transcriptional regulator